MKRKQLLILVAVLAGLVLVAYASGVFTSNVSTIEVPDLGIPSGKVQTITIERPNDTITLSRESGVWMLTAPMTARADTTTTGRLVQALGDLSFSRIVSTDPERHGRYGVDSTAKTVTITWPGGEQKLLVGNQGPDYQTMFVRLPGDDRVFATAGRLDVMGSLDTFRDKTVASIATADVASVAVQRDDQSYQIENGPDGWQLTQDDATSPADSAAVARWLGRFSSLRASGGFLDDVSPQDVRANGGLHLAFHLIDGGAPEISAQAMGDTLAVTTADAQATFHMYASQKDTYFPEASTLVSGN